MVFLSERLWMGKPGISSYLKNHLTTLFLRVYDEPAHSHISWQDCQTRRVKIGLNLKINVSGCHTSLVVAACHLFYGLRFSYIMQFSNKTKTRFFLDSWYVFCYNTLLSIHIQFIYLFVKKKWWLKCAAWMVSGVKSPLLWLKLVAEATGGYQSAECLWSYKAAEHLIMPWTLMTVIKDPRRPAQPQTIDRAQPSELGM